MSANRYAIACGSVRCNFDRFTPLSTPDVSPMPADAIREDSDYSGRRPSARGHRNGRGSRSHFSSWLCGVTSPHRHGTLPFSSPRRPVDLVLRTRSSGRVSAVRVSQLALLTGEYSTQRFIPVSCTKRCTKWCIFRSEDVIAIPNNPESRICSL